MTTKEEECVRIVEELVERNNREYSNAYVYVPHDLMNRAINAVKAVKPKASSPFTITANGVELDVFEDTEGIFQVKKGPHKLGMSDKDFDRVLVEGLKHRGVDLRRLCQLGRWGCDPELTARYDCCEQCDLSHITHAIQPILDNAEAD